MRPFIVAFALCLTVLGTSGCQREVVLVAASATIPKTNSKVVSVAELCDLLNDNRRGTEIYVVMTKKFIESFELSLNSDNPNQSQSTQPARSVSHVDYCVVYTMKRRMPFFLSSYIDKDLGSDYFIVKSNHVSNEFLKKAIRENKKWRQQEWAFLKTSLRPNFYYLFNHMIKQVKEYNFHGGESTTNINNDLIAWRNDFTVSGSVHVAIHFELNGKVTISDNVISFENAMDEIEPASHTHVYKLQVED